MKSSNTNVVYPDWDYINLLSSTKRYSKRRQDIDLSIAIEKEERLLKKYLTTLS